MISNSIFDNDSNKHTISSHYLWYLKPNSLYITTLCQFSNLELEHSPTLKILRRWKKPMPVIASSTKRTFNLATCVSVYVCVCMCVCQNLCECVYVGGWACRIRSPELTENGKLYTNPIRMRAEQSSLIYKFIYIHIYKLYYKIYL